MEQYLRRVYNDDEVRAMGELILRTRVVDLFVVHRLDKHVFVDENESDYEWTDPRSDSPLNWEDLIHGEDISDDDESDPEYVVDIEEGEDESKGGESTFDDVLDDDERFKDIDGNVGESKFGDVLDYDEGFKDIDGNITFDEDGFEAEEQFEDDGIEIDGEDISDEEITVTRERVRGCNKKLFELAQQLQREAGEGKIPDATTSKKRSDVEGASTQAAGYSSEYEDSEEHIHTPVQSDDDGNIEIRGSKRNKHLNSSWLVEQFLEVYEAIPHWPAKEIIETVRRAYKTEVKKNIAYKVKYCAYKMLHGSMKDHYLKLGWWLKDKRWRSVPLFFTQESDKNWRRKRKKLHGVMKWDMCGIPYAYAVASINFCRLTAKDFTDGCFKKDVYMKAYSGYMPLIEGERHWPRFDLEIDPPPITIEPGRPRKNRRKDPFEPKKKPGMLSRHGIEMTCTLCNTKGHNKRRCSNKDKGDAPNQPPLKKSRGRPKASGESSGANVRTPSDANVRTITAEPTRVGRGERVIISGRGRARRIGRGVGRGTSGGN
ncbi:Replicase polyprotein 1a [Bienertia sinuspersici]